MTALLKRNGLLLAAVFVSAAAFAQSNADSLTLVSGETLTGTLVDIDEGLVEFRTRHGSHTYHPIDQIRTGSIVAAREITFADSSRRTGTLSIQDGALMLGAGGRTESIDAKQVIGVKRVKEKAFGQGGMGAGFETGVLLRGGNRSRTDLYARIELNRDTDWYRWNWYATGTLDGSDEFPRYLRSEFEWNRAPSTRVTPFVLAGFARDRDAALDNRLFAAAGIERSWLDWFGGDVRAGVGIGPTRERFDGDGDLRWRIDERRLFRDISWTQTELDLYLRIVYEARLRDRLTFRDELRFVPSLTDAGAFRASYDSGFAWKLTDGLELNLRLRIDYDDDPAFESLDEWNAAIGAGVRLQFGTR